MAKDKSPKLDGFDEEAKLPRGSKPAGADVEIIRPGKDEMNLVEYPFAALRREDASLPVIELQWENRHPISKKVVKALWRVAGDPTWGLPTASDEKLYLVLMEISREAGFQNPMIFFSCYDVLRRLGWPDNQKHYDMLRQSFERLKSVNIITRNAFWNHEHKSFVNTGFSLIEVYEILAEKPGRKASAGHEPNSFFKWNDVMFSSIRAGFLKTLDLDLAFSLRSPIALRLYRYLDKKAYDGRASFEIELGVLCERHLGMAPSPYASKYKERLKPAHEELLSRGFLAEVTFAAMKTRRGDKVAYTFARATAQPSAQPSALPTHGKAAEMAEIEAIAKSAAKEQPSLPLGLPGIVIEPGTSHGSSHATRSFLPLQRSEPQADSQSTQLDTQSELLEQMIALKVSPEVARELVESTPEEDLQLQLLCLPYREPKNPAATLVKAVRENWEAPSSYFSRLEAQQRPRNPRPGTESGLGANGSLNPVSERLKAIEEEETARLDTMWGEMDESARQKLEAEARLRLGVLGQAGRAQAALAAMRRNLLREKLTLSKNQTV